MYDVIIIGAGPAGLTAGIYLARAGIKTLILEKETIGGQIASSPFVENYPGYSKISGSELADNLYEQLDNLGVEIQLEEVIKIETSNIKKVTTNYNTYETKCIIIATGAKYRTLGLENEGTLIGKGIHFCVSCDGAFYKDKNVAVIGGANTAVTNALYLSNICNQVYLLCREEELQCEKVLIEKVQNTKNIEIYYDSLVTKINGNDYLESIDVKIQGEVKNFEISAMFESIGMKAQTEIVNNLLETTPDKYIKNNEGYTNIDGIFTAGDCRDKRVRQLTTATSDGTIAAYEAIDYLKTK